MRFRRPLLSCAILLGVVLGTMACSSSSSSTPTSATPGSSTPGSVAGPTTGASSGSSSKTPGGPQPSGTVTVTSGGKTVCVITLKDGTGTCNVDTAGYQPGDIKFTGTYKGAAGFKAGSGSTTLQLKPAS